MRCVSSGSEERWPTVTKLRDICGKLSSSLKCHPVVLETCSSTQDVGRELADAGAPEGTLVIAREMTSGRGRMGRRWVAGPEGLWFTLILRPPSTTNVHLIPLAAGVAVAESLRRCGFDARIKWPNDVLVKGFKVSGVLTEGVAEGMLRYVLLGVGVNTNNNIPYELKGIASSLRELSGQYVSNYAVLKNFMEVLGSLYQELSSGNEEEVLTAWRRRNCTLGRAVKVILPNGAEFTGIATDVEGDGSLRVKTDEGEVVVMSGDVIHLRLEV
ncbi:MAG: biotin--[acetyl-CoA-carboxylase] ligase [Desulfurococcales archaeon]|nr:biotin--[acetyl-CoA-carboxylase] ligase [Desulfurococcales archaeon]